MATYSIGDLGRREILKMSAVHAGSSAGCFRRAVTRRRVVQRLPSNVLVAGSWMIPRLPMKRPRCAIATTSPNGVTRFCRGLRPLPINL